MKKNKEIPVNRFILPLLFIVFSILIEIVNFLYLGFKTSGGALQVFPYAWMFNIGAILIIAGLIYISTNKRVMLAIFYIFLILQLILNTINANIYNVFGDIFTLDYIALGEEAVAAIRAEFIDFWSIALYVGILAVIITVTTILYKKNKKTVTLRRMGNWALALALLIVFEASGATIVGLQYKNVTEATADTIENNTAYLWDSFEFKLDAYKQFGYYGFYIKNICDSIKGRGKLGFGEEEELTAYIDEGKVAANPDALLANDNLIVILCESHDAFAYDPILTPNVWNLINGEACYFSSFHTDNKTNVSEGIVISGNIPKDYGLDVYVNNFGYDYAYNLPKVFERAHEDAKTTYIHSYESYMYKRKTTYGNKGYGFDQTIFVDDNEVKPAWFGDWKKEVDFFNSYADQIIPEGEGKFMTAYATVSTHGPYTYENPDFKDEYAKYDANAQEFEAWFEEYYKGYTIPKSKGMRQQFRRYKAAMIDFDNMVGALLARLEETGHLNDTTLVMYGDHNCYYDNLTFEVKNVSKSDYSNIEAHRVPLVIYNSKLKAGEYTQFCSTYDIYPTLCQLHGLEYNKNLIHGYNLFSEEIENAFFASHKGGMFDENFYSDNISDCFPVHENYTEQEVKAFKAKAELYYSKQAKIERILAFNLAK